MTVQEELDFFLKRHNAVARHKALTTAAVAILAWVLCPVLFSAIFYLVTRIFLKDGALPPTILWTLIYPAINGCIILWRILLGRLLTYDANGNLFHILFWPAYMTAECLNQMRQLTGLSRSERAVAHHFLTELHAAGPDGFIHRPTAADKALLEKLESLGALRITMPHADGVRLTRREPFSFDAIPTRLQHTERPPIGLIAGGGQLPILQAQGMRAAGRRVIGIGLREQYDPELVALCDEFVEASPARPGSWVRLLAKRGAFEAVMVGYVDKTKLYRPLEVLRHLPDLTALRLLLRRDRRSQGMLFDLAETLKDKGLLLMSTTAYIPQHLASLGAMTRRAPSQESLRDIQLALPILRQLNELDIGQGLCVKAGDVIALEAMEGTDRMIARAGELCPRGGWTLLKGSDPDKDPRFDVPTIGVKTIENLRKAGAGTLAVVADRTIFVNKPEVLAAAEKAGICVYGVALD